MSDHCELAGGTLPYDRKIARETAKGIREIHEAMGAMMGMAAARDSELQMHSEDERQHLMRVMWATEIITAYFDGIYESLHTKQVFTNTDGDSLLFCTLEFPVKGDWLKIAGLMSIMNGFVSDRDQSDQQHIFWNWIDVRRRRSKKSSLLPDDASSKQDKLAYDAQIMGTDIE